MVKGISAFSTQTIVLIPLAIALNLVGGEVVARLNLPIVPLYLDSLGTVLVGVLAGPWAGALTGGLSNLIWGLFRPTAVPFAITACVIGLVAGGLAAAGFFHRWWLALLGGLLTGIIAATVSAPIVAYVFGGVTGGPTDILVAYLRAQGADTFQAAYGQSLFSDQLDKTITFLVVWAVLQGLPQRLLQQFPGGHRLLSRPEEG